MRKKLSDMSKKELSVHYLRKRAKLEEQDMTVLESFDIAGIDIYQIQDGTWRVRSYWTEEERDIETLAQAMEVAERIDGQRPY